MSLAGNIGGEELGRDTSMTKVGVAAFIGALVEWYDYFLYGLAASTVFTQLFFLLKNRLFATLAAFATFGVGFFFCPLGGAIFGHYGDRLGRKAILVLTLLLMGLATFLMGVLPTFQSVGLLAPILLVVLRALQGVAVGNGAMFATQPAYFSELFGTNVRYSGVSLGYQLSAVFAGGLAPFIATALLGWAGSYWPVALYVMAAGLISFVSVYLATESFREDLTEELARDPTTQTGDAGQTS